MTSFLENTRERFGAAAAAELALVLKAMDLPDPKDGAYLGGTEGGAVFLNRYGLVLSIGPRQESPEHDLIVQPLCPPKKLTDENGRSLVISLLPGIEGVLRSYTDVSLLRQALGADGIDFWDTHGAKGLENGGYLRAPVEGFPDGLPLVLDRGGVSPHVKGPQPVDPKSLAANFNASAVKGVQQKYFAPFRASLAAAWPESKPLPSRAGMKDFLALCEKDIGRGKNATLSNRWAQNHRKTGMFFVNKPLDVKNAAAAFERQLRWHRLRAQVSSRLSPAMAALGIR